jgi:membrane associated rhomboid family serine protease
VTWVLIALNVAAFGVELAMGADPIAPKAQDVLRVGADYAPRTLHGESWRIVTSMFLHFGLIHIAMNMLILAQGRIVEVAYGHLGFVAIYFVSGLLGGVGSLAHAPNVVSAGASGAVFGVFGAFGAVLLLRRDRIDPAVWQRAARGLGTFIVLNLVIGLQSKTIDVTAHVVGLITGFAVGAVQLVGNRAAEQHSKRALAALLAGVVVTAVTLIAMPAPRDLDAVLADVHVVEHQCVTTYNERLRQGKANEITPAAFADAIDKEVLAPWRALRARVEAVPEADIPPRLRSLFEVLRTYIADRQEAWEARSALNRNVGHNTDEARTHADELEIRAQNDIDRLEAEVKSLK